MKKNFKKIIMVLFIFIFFWIISISQKKIPTTIQLGVFSGSMYGVPTMQSYRIFDEAIEKFESKNKNIKLKYNYGTLKADYSEWLSAKILKGDAPDVFVVLEEDFNTFSSLGILEELDSKIYRDKDFYTGRFYEQALALGKANGTQYAIPMEIDPVLLFVNKTLLKKEGIEIDKDKWTWEEFYNVCKRVTKDTDGDKIIDQFGVVDFTWQDLVYTNGQTLFSKNGKKSEFSKEGVVEAISFARKLNNLSPNSKATIEDLNNGHVLFKPFPFSWYRVYNSYPYKLIRYSGFEWECIKLPRGPKGKNSSMLKSYLIGMNSKGKKKKEAWEFLKFLTSDNNVQLDVFKYSQGVPVIKEVTESKRADEELRKYNSEEELGIDKQVLGEIIEDSIIDFKFKKYGKAMQLSDLYINKIIRDNEDIKEALLKLDKDLTELLND